ncbi:C10 family peptidase [Sunxiuqinia elliptica]
MKKIFLFLVSVLFLFSCDDSYENIIVEEERVIYSDEVSVDDAKMVAQSFAVDISKYEKSATTSQSGFNRGGKIKDISEIEDKNGGALMYVFNFSDGGFCIVSASKKVEPVLAYSETGYFDKNDIPNIGISIWLEETSSIILNCDSLSETQIASNRLKWMGFEESSLDIYSYGTTYSSTEAQQRQQAFNQRMGELSGGPNMVMPLSYAANYLPPNRLQHFKSLAAQHGSPEEFTIIEIIDKTLAKSIGPLINTNWHQSSPFNGLVPNDYAGCTAVAAGQIMYFHKHPSTYNWSNMSGSNLYYYDDIKYLMRDLGQSFDMSYDNDGSGATINNVKSGLERDYGYHVTKKDHSIVDIENSLFDFQQPVYLTGKRTTVIPGLIYKDGHAWVCEGAKVHEPNKAYRIEWQVGSNGSYRYETNGITYNESAGVSTAQGYMNWGWGSSYNGWYGLNSAQPNSEYNYKYSRVNLYIKPN